MWADKRRVTALVLGFLLAACGPVGESLSGADAMKIDVERFPLRAFLTCDIYIGRERDPSSTAFIEAMRPSLTPLQKTDNWFEYRTEGVVSLHGQELPLRRTRLGVCNAEGEIACGSATLIVLEIDLPLHEARARLLQLRDGLGVDYTMESRPNGPESSYLDRPHLVPDMKNFRQSLLYCSPAT